MKYKNIKREWFNTNEIGEEHLTLPVNQVYVWMWTKDKKITLVKTEKGQVQFPGGKQDPKDKSLVDTAIREVKEETGFNLESYKNDLHMFGYYVIQDLMLDTNREITFIQLRYLICIDKKSSEIELSPNEPDEPNPVVEAGFYNLVQIQELLPWLKGGNELASFLNRIRE